MKTGRRKRRKMRNVKGKIIENSKGLFLFYFIYLFIFIVCFSLFANHRNFCGVYQNENFYWEKAHRKKNNVNNFINPHPEKLSVTPLHEKHLLPFLDCMQMYMSAWLSATHGTSCQSSVEWKFAMSMSTQDSSLPPSGCLIAQSLNLNLKDNIEV